jgi:hypothetical protein
MKPYDKIRIEKIATALLSKTYPNSYDVAATREAIESAIMIAEVLVEKLDEKESNRLKELAALYSTQTSGQEEVG